MEDTIQKANILIVDDKPAKLQALESVLLGLDENILTARSGKEALKLVLKKDFAVIRPMWICPKWINCTG